MLSVILEDGNDEHTVNAEDENKEHALNVITNHIINITPSEQ